MAARDWNEWHQAYEDPRSPLARRLAIVRGHVRAFLDARPTGQIRVLGLCSGDGRDLLPVLAEHPAGARARARLIELDPLLAAAARTAASAAGLVRVEVVEGDAGVTAAYAGAVPADLLLACGVFGNVPDRDVERTLDALPMLVAADGVVVWTRHRRSPDLTPAIRGRLESLGFDEIAFDSPGPGSFAVGAHRATRDPVELVRGRRLFAFVG